MVMVSAPEPPMTVVALRLPSTLIKSLPIPPSMELFRALREMVSVSAPLPPVTVLLVRPLPRLIESLPA